MFIQDKNPFRFVVDSLQLFNVTKNRNIISVPNTSTISTELKATIFEAEQTIRSTVVYKNGIRHSKTWKLYVNPAATKEEN